MKRLYLLRLSWPDKALSSNARIHWTRRAKAVAAYRAEACAEAQARGAHREPWRGATLRFAFYPPDRRRRDAHNLPAAMKAAIDGIADAIGCDDSRFVCEFPGSFEEPCKGGAVLITLEPRE